MNNSTRITIIDALRGFSLAGVALVHMTEQYIAGPSPENFMEGLNSWPDYTVSTILQIFFIGKFFALFSILFGLSFSIQMDSAKKKGKNFSWRFLWRGILLFVIGMIHQFFYRGDILTIYALLVPFFIPFYRVPNRWLIGTAIFIFLGVPRFISFAVFGSESILGLPSQMDFENPMVADYFSAIQSGSFYEVLQQNIGYGMKTKMDYQLSFFGRFYYTLGYFLLGLWIGKLGLFRNIDSFKPKIKNTILWSFGGVLTAMVLTAVTFMTAPQPVDMSKWQHILGINFMDWISISMTIIILSAFIILYQKSNWQKKLTFFSPYGRMALSNYILQSIIGTFVLFGWGLGYLGKIRTLYLFLIALLLIGMQAVLSRIWLQYFRYGPLEWLWRCGTYLKWQKLKK